MTEDQIIEVLDRQVRESSYRRLGPALGFSPAFLAQVVRRKTPVSARLAEAMGYRRVVKFEPAMPSDAA